MMQYFTADRFARLQSHDDAIASAVDAEWDAATWRRKTRFLLAGMIAVLVVAGIVAYSAGWLSANYVPTSESLRDPNNPARAFIISEEKIWGIYGNLDVDSIVFQYKSGETDAEEYWAQVDNRAAGSGWQLVESRDGTRIYQMFHNAEQIRIGYDIASRTATVAWVQTDQSRPPDHFPDAESEFAAEVIWPMFERLTAKSGD